MGSPREDKVRVDADEVSEEDGAGVVCDGAVQDTVGRVLESADLVSEMDELFEEIVVEDEKGFHGENHVLLQRRGYEFLRERGLAEAIVREITEAPRVWLDFDKSEEFKAEVIGMIAKVVPRRFLVDNVEQWISIKREAIGTVEVPNDDDGKLYHWTTPEAFISILRSGGFKRSTEVDESVIGTGDFEKLMGADGIFVTYKEPYSLSNEDDHPILLVFSKRHLYDSSTVCIENELSLPVTAERVNDALYDVYDTEDFYSVIDERDRVDFARKYVLRVLLSVLEHIMFPEEMGGGEEEASLNPDSLELSDVNMVLVAGDVLMKNDPQQIYQGMRSVNPGFAEEVPILDAVAAAMAITLNVDDEEITSLVESGEVSDSEVCVLFVEAVARGEIKAREWGEMDLGSDFD